MKDDPLLDILTIFASLSFLAIGGANAVVPEIHAQVVTARGWVNDGDFARLFALAQAAPGPNVLFSSLLGWNIAGFGGFVAATIGMNGPSCVIALVMSRIRRKALNSRWLIAAQNGLVPIAIGLMLASGVITAKAADVGVVTVVLTILGAAAILRTSLNPLWILALGALVGLFGDRLGLT